MQPPAQEVSQGQSDVRVLLCRKYHSALALFFCSSSKHLLLVRVLPSQTCLFLCYFSLKSHSERKLQVSSKGSTTCRQQITFAISA